MKGDLLNPSYYPSRADAANVTKNWYIVDAKGQTLGRLATLIATYIRCEQADQQQQQHRDVMPSGAQRALYECQHSAAQQRS